MLDEISRALPGMLWLTELKQTGREVVLSGESLSVTALTDFVSNLQSTGYFERSDRHRQQHDRRDPAGAG